MKILLISGDHKRHKNFASVIDSKFELVSWIVEKREDSLPKIYRFKNKIDKTNFNYHFKRMNMKKYFKYNEKKLIKKVKLQNQKKYKENQIYIKNINQNFNYFWILIIPNELLKNF